MTRFCFAASYGVALGLEAARLRWPGRTGVRAAGLGFGAAGLLAHTIYLVLHPASPASPVGSLLLLAWVLAVFYLYGSVHHRRFAWAVFVLPVVLALVLLAEWVPGLGEGTPLTWGWGAVHGGLVFCAAVGVSVGFLASVMYLVQSSRLASKTPPTQGLRLLSLERLEDMNRRAVLWAFPFLTAGLLVGLLLSVRHGGGAWTAPKVLGTAGLWLVFVLLIYLRYGAHLPARRLALVTVAAFGLLVVTLAASHPFAVGGVEGP